MKTVTSAGPSKGRLVTPYTGGDNFYDYRFIINLSNFSCNILYTKNWHKKITAQSQNVAVI